MQTHEEHKIFWKLSLSNGETLYENKGDYLRLPNELSPWERLKGYIAQNDLTITSLGLYSDDGRTFNLPSSGKNPKFKAFDDQRKPVGYSFFRKAGADYGKDWEIYSVAEADYGDFRLQLWVQNNNTNNFWLSIV